MAPTTPSASHDAAVAELATELRQVRAELDALKGRRRAGRRTLAAGLVALSALAAAGLAHASTLTDGLYVFVANEPAVATEINANFSTLRQYLRNKVGQDLTSQNVAVPGTLSAGATTVGSLSTGGSVSAGSLTVSGATVLSGTTVYNGYELSCGESSFSSSLNGFAFCCQLNVRNGETKCNLATTGGATSWSGSSFVYPNLGATTLGRYHLSCVAGAPGANYPFCCRMDALTGSTVCGQGNSYTLGSAGNSSVPF